MRIPNAEQAFIPIAKLQDYLLNSAHPRGGPKAVFFKQKGFDLLSLSQALADHVFGHGFVKMTVEDFGQKFIVEGPAKCPDGSEVFLRTVWMVLNGDENPTFVTAYPIKK